MSFVAKKGQGLVEYGLIIVLIVLIAALAAAALGPAIAGTFDKATNTLNK